MNASKLEVDCADGVKATFEQDPDDPLNLSISLHDALRLRWRVKLAREDIIALHKVCEEILRADPDAACHPATGWKTRFRPAPGACPHPDALRQRWLNGEPLPRYPLRYGSAEVEICRACEQWRLPSHGRGDQWYDGPYLEVLQTRLLEEEE